MTRFFGRRLAPLAAALFLLMAVAAPAEAAKPTREPAPLTQDLALNGMCAFPVVTSDVRGHGFSITFYDKSGDVSRIVLHFPGLMSQFTNVLTGESITVNNSGKVVIIPQEDGSLTVIQTGQSVAGDQGKVTGNPYLVHVSGRIVTTFVPTTDPNAEFPFDVASTTRTGHVTDLCAALAS